MNLIYVYRSRQQGQTSTTRLSFPAAQLFFPGDLAQLVGQLFVNLSSVTNREDPDDPRVAIQLVNDAKSSDFEFPRPDNSRLRGAPENGSALKNLSACLMLRFTSGGRWRLISATEKHQGQVMLFDIYVSMPDFETIT